MDRIIVENIVNDIISRILNEGVLVDPNNRKRDIINFKVNQDKETNAITVKVFTNVTRDIAGRVAQSNPNLVCPNGLRLQASVDAAKIPTSQELANISNPAEYSPDMKNLLDYCNIIRNLYGDFNMNDVLDQIHFTASQVLGDDERAMIDKNEDNLFQELLDILQTPRGKLLAKSLRSYFPVKSVDYRNSSRNITKILATDRNYIRLFESDEQLLEDGCSYFYEKDGLYPKGTVSGGQITVGQLKQQLGVNELYMRPPATFVAKPQDWRKMYNRKIYTTALPYWLCDPNDSGEFNDEDLENGVRRNLGKETNAFLAGKSARTKYQEVGANKNTQGTTRFMTYAGKQAADDRKNAKKVYTFFPYYDICDTYLIEGEDDEFFSDERIGVLDNIKWKPTQATAKQTADKMGIDAKPEDYDKQIELRRDSFDYRYSYQVFLALKVLGGKKVTIPPRLLDTNGKPKPEVLQKLNMDLLKKYVYEVLLANMEGKNYDKIREEKAKWIAVLFAAAHNIAPNYVWNEYHSLNKDEASDSAIASVFDKNYLTNKSLYSTLCRNINGQIDDNLANRKDIPLQQVGESHEYNVNIYDQHVTEFRKMLDEHRFIKDSNLLKETHMKVESKFYRLLDKMNNTKL